MKVLANTLEIGDKVKYQASVAKVTKIDFQFGRKYIYISYFDGLSTEFSILSPHDDVELVFSTKYKKTKG